MKPLYILLYLAALLLITGCTEIFNNTQPQKANTETEHTDALVGSQNHDTESKDDLSQNGTSFISTPVSGDTTTQSAEPNTSVKDESDEQQSISDKNKADDTSQTNEAETAAQKKEKERKKILARLDQSLDLCHEAQEQWQTGELDLALITLDQAYFLILPVNSSEDPDIIQQKEDLRFMISKRIMEIYASRNTVANGHHNEIPLIMNSHVEREIKRYTKREKNFFLQSYKRSGRYREEIVKLLKEAGLPEELSWLPLIESGFKVKALSKARALGLWQFIPSTGYKFGLKRDLYVDERLDPLKATKAAISYLTALHNIFGDWETVLAAYNCGEGRVLRVIRKQNINYLDNFWDLYNKLPRETSDYVPRFLATLHIINNPKKYGMDLDHVKMDKPFDFSTVVIEKQVYLKDIAKITSISHERLRDLNPELRYSLLPDREYTLNTPPGTEETVLSSIALIKKSSPPVKAFVYHKVKRGESLSTIAKRYNTSVRSIAAANNIGKSYMIRAGRTIKIPQRGYKQPSPKLAKSKKNYRHPKKHIVKRGDSLWIIARRYDTRISIIMELNNLTSKDLHIGQVLNIPPLAKKTPVSIPAGGKIVYTVKQGDSPYSISKKFKISLKQFMAINNLSNKSSIYPGQELMIN